MLTHVFDITLAVFDIAQHVVNKSAGVITGSTAIDVSTTITSCCLRHLLTAYQASRHLSQIQGQKGVDGFRANTFHGGKKLPQRRDERQDHPADKGVESGAWQADRRAETA